MNELEKLHSKKAAILTDQRALLAECQDCIKATVQSVLSTIQSPDNANILYVRSAVESTLEAATENQYLLLEPEAQFVPEFTRCDERRLQRVVHALNNVGVVVDKCTCAETTTAAGSGLERANPGEVAFFNITARDAQRLQRTVGSDTFAVELKNNLVKVHHTKIPTEGLKHRKGKKGSPDMTAFKHLPPAIDKQKSIVF